MQNYNKVTVTGHLTRDPETRHTSTGTPVCNFGLAVNRRYKEANGDPRDETVYLDMSAWAKLAELCQNSLIKGSHCLVEGRLAYDSWEDKATGEKKSRIKVIVAEVIFLSRSDKPTE